MPILENINADFIAAMKEKSENKLSTLRLLRAALKYKQIELTRELKDDDILAVIRTQIKQLKESLLSFESAGRRDLAEKSQNELSILERYLPAEILDSELEPIIRQALVEAGLTSKIDTGKAMGIAMKAVVGRANSGRVKDWLDKILV